MCVPACVTAFFKNLGLMDFEQDSPAAKAKKLLPENLRNRFDLAAIESIDAKKIVLIFKKGKELKGGIKICDIILLIHDNGKAELKAHPRVREDKKEEYEAKVKESEELLAEMRRNGDFDQELCVPEQNGDLPFMPRDLDKLSPKDLSENLGKGIANILQGIVKMHRAGYVHRDIKPANILVDGNGNMKLGDFDGLVKIAEAGESRFGTPRYKSIEEVAQKLLQEGKTDELDNTIQDLIEPYREGQLAAAKDYTSLGITFLEKLVKFKKGSLAEHLENLFDALKNEASETYNGYYPGNDVLKFSNIENDEDLSNGEMAFLILRQMPEFIEKCEEIPGTLKPFLKACFEPDTEKRLELFQKHSADFCKALKGFTP